MKYDCGDFAVLIILSILKYMQEGNMVSVSWAKERCFFFPAVSVLKLFLVRLGLDGMSPQVNAHLLFDTRLWVPWPFKPLNLV